MTTTLVPHPHLTATTPALWWRITVAALSGITALGAWYGTWYLTDERAARELPTAAPDFLPGGWSFGGFALLVLVAAPMTVACLLAVTGHTGAAAAATIAGGLLVGWIVVQVLLIGLVFWLQPAMFVLGAAVALLGLVELRRDLPSGGDTPAT
ncbi:MAG: hypothetical protein U0R64_08515 [Candidatus Nanopelagicales bacterium]